DWVKIYRSLYRSLDSELLCHTTQSSVDCFPMRSALSHLECSRSQCRKVLEHSIAQNLCTACGSPLLARYDLAMAPRSLTLVTLRSCSRVIWRYEEVMPRAIPVTLGEGMTPLVHARRLGERLGLRNLCIKDKGQNPTGSFKARGLSAAVSMARELGVETIALPTAGNAGGAAAAYATQAGLKCVVAMPSDTPAAKDL